MLFKEIMNTNVEEDSDSGNNYDPEYKEDCYESNEEGKGKGGIRYMTVADRNREELSNAGMRVEKASGRTTDQIWTIRRTRSNMFVPRRNKSVILYGRG